MGDLRTFSAGWSVSRLAQEFGMARATVSKRLRESGVPPLGERNGSPVYQLADAASALVGTGGGGANDGGVIDPRDLPPKERKDFFQSENERLKVEMTMGTLVPAVEVEADMADLVKQIVQFLDTLPDDLERKLALKPEQVVKVQERCDRIRQLMYERVVTDESDGDARDSA
ncbi:DUF1441 family protein [Luteimonas sp. SMYT11W]|uniref:DUF1441 family protein n=1 Tax=Luteimonas flava TaxID=3115822 RepID=A0ABU7WDB8_9GAMM